MSEHRSEFDSVPAPEGDAVPDEHFLELVGPDPSIIPFSHMSSSPQRPPWMRLVAWAVVLLLVAATAAGIGLAYGLGDFFS